MFFNRKKSGSNLIEYSIPAALIGVTVGLGIYATFQDGSLFNSYVKSTGGVVDVLGGKLAFGTGEATGGIFVGPDGILKLNNNTGESVILPYNFYNEYKDNILEYLNNGEFDKTSASSLAVETAGAAGIEEFSNETATPTDIYASLLDIAAENTTDESAKGLLNSMSLYGKKVGVIESDLIDVKKIISDKKDIFNVEASSYLKAKDIFADLYSTYTSKKEAGETIEDNLVEKMNTAFDQVSEHYDDYTLAVNKYQKATSDYVDIANGYFKDLKEKTGATFDNVLDDIIASTIIMQDTKDLVVPIGEKIKAIKDSVQLMKDEVNYLSSTFDSQNKGFSEIEESFTSFQVYIDNNAGNATMQAAGQVPGQGKGKNST